MRPSLTPFHFLTLFCTSFIAVPVSMLPNVIMETAEQDAWFGLIGGCLLCYLFLLLLYFSQRAFEKRGNQVPHMLKYGMLLCFLFFLLASATLTIRNLSEVTHTYFMLDTPPIVISLALLSVAAYGAWFGLDNIARLSLLSFLLAAAAIFSIPFLIFGEIEPMMLVPLLSHSLPTILYSVMLSTGACLESFFLITILPLVSIPPERRCALLTTSCLIAMILLFVLFTLVFFTFGPFLGSKFMFASVELFRYLAIGEFWERMDILFISVWTVIVTVKLALLLWLILLETAIVFRLSEPRSALLPISLLLMFVSQLLTSSTSTFLYLYKHLWMYMVFFGYGSLLAFYLIPLRARKYGRAKL